MPSFGSEHWETVSLELFAILYQLWAMLSAVYPFGLVLRWLLNQCCASFYGLRTHMTLCISSHISIWDTSQISKAVTFFAFVFFSLKYKPNYIRYGWAGRVYVVTLTVRVLCGHWAVNWQWLNFEVTKLVDHQHLLLVNHYNFSDHLIWFDCSILSFRVQQCSTCHRQEHTYSMGVSCQLHHHFY